MWDVVESDFGGDETTNFGPRKESGTALYQIDTLATISSREKVSGSAPHIVSAVLGELACLAVGAHLSVFKDCQFAITLGFGSTIDELEWSPDGIFLVIGDRGGNLTILDADSFETIFAFKAASKTEEESKTYKKISFHQKKDDVYDLLVLTAEGQVLVIHDINTDLFTSEESISVLKSEKSLVLETRTFHTQDTLDVLGCNNYIFTLGSGDSILMVWRWNNGTLEAEDEVGGIFSTDIALVQGRISSDGNYMITLDSTNSMMLWQMSMLTVLYTWSEQVSEFQFLEAHEFKSNSLQDMKLVVLSLPSEDQCSLKILTLPRCETVYNLQLNVPTFTAKCITMQETLYIAECCCEDSNPGHVSTVRFRCLTETNPETRLARLLQKNKFEEAEFFAKAYGLDMELVQKVKTNSLLDKLSPWNLPKYGADVQEKMMAQLWSSLRLIKDDLHVAGNCMRAALPTLSATQEMLDYCKKWLIKIAASGDNDQLEKQQKLLTKLLTIQHRLTTYQMAFGSDAYSGDSWDQFMAADLLQETLLWFDKRKINIGFQIWARHQNEWDKKMSASYVEHILLSIPEDVDSFEILGSICDSVIPYVVRVLPNSLSTVVDWITQRAENMELLEKSKWPSNAIQFLHFIHSCVQDVLKVTHKDSACTAYDNANKIGLIAKNTIQPLQALIRNLQHLHDLQTKYRCPMKYDAFLQETTETVAFRMLDKVVAIELIEQTLEQQIRPYMKQHKLKEDLIFSKYVRDLLERTGRLTTCMGPTSWEHKVIAVIGCISSPQRKCEAIIEAMKWAPIPWSSEIEELVKEGLKIEHQSVTELKEQCRLLGVKKQMLKYGLKAMEVPDKTHAGRLINFILSRDTKDCVEDAISIMNLYGLKLETEMYLFRMRYLISRGKIDEYLELLQSVAVDKGSHCGRRVVSLGVVILDDPLELDIEENHRMKRQFTEASVVTCRFLVSVLEDHLELQEYEELQKTLKKIYSLQIEYNNYMTISEYRDAEYRKEIFVKYVKEIFTESEDSKKLSKMKIYRLAHIMQIPRAELQGQLAIEAATNRDIKTAVGICSELFQSDPTDETAQILFQVALSFQHLQADAEVDICNDNKLRELPELTLKLASQALTICSTDMLMQCLELYKVAHLTQSVIQQCETGDYSLCVETLGAGSTKPTSTPYKDWTMSPQFKEDALVMNSGTILPLVSQYTVAHPLLADQEPETSDVAPDMSRSLYNKVVPVIQHLKENNQIQLAYRFLLHYTSITVQFIDISAEQLAKGSSQKLQLSFVLSLIQKIFSCNAVDHMLALTYLITLQSKDSRQCLEYAYTAATSNHKRLMGIATVGTAFGSLFEDTDLITMNKQMETNASWGYRLSKAKITIKSALGGPLADRFKLLHQIAPSPLIDLQVVKDFCSDFGLEQSEGLRDYMQHIFTSLNSEVGLKADVKKKQLSKAKAVIREIGFSENLAANLKNIYAETNPYDYEMIKVVLEENQWLDPQPYFEKGLKLIDYLKVYKRRAGPSEYELGYGTRGNRENEAIILDLLPPDSRTNIPFHPLLDGDPWKIITQELDKDTVETWLPIARLLRLSADQIFLTAVQNLVRKYVASIKKPDVMGGGGLVDKSQWNWDERDANFQLLKDVDSLLSNVSNYEIALACANWMVKELPIGSEKVLGLKGCIQTAEIWYQSSPDETAEKERAKAAFAKFTTVWQRLATEQVLYLNGLCGQDFVKVANKANTLILRLFEHPAVLEAGDLDQQGKPDIYHVAEKICEINNINLHLMKISLVEKWLPSLTSKQTDADSTMTLDLQAMKMADENDPEDEDEKNLKRVLYILKRGNLDENIRYLWCYIKEEDNVSSLTNRCQVRALQCVLELDKDHFVEGEFKKSTQDLRYMIRINSYLVELEKLNMRHTISTFENCNKEGLIKGIWRNHRHQKVACMLVASLCLDYGYHDYQLWNSVLQQMFAYKLMDHLEYVLVRLSGIPDVWQIPCYHQVWQAVLALPLTRAVAPVGEDQIDMCIHSFNLISRCPVFHELDMSSLSRHYMKLELPVCALGCLTMAHTNNKESIKSILSLDKAKLLEDVKFLVEQGLNSAIAAKVERLIYDEIGASEDFPVVISTKFEKKFVEHMLQTDQVDGLLKFAIVNHRLKHAEILFDLYCKRYPEVMNTVMDYIEDEADGYLKAYLKMRGFEDIAERI